MTQTSPTQFPLGTVVEGEDVKRHPRLGHVVGFARSDTGEILLKVLWDNGETEPAHPSSITASPARWPQPWPPSRCFAELDARLARERTSKPRGMLESLALKIIGRTV